MCYTDDTELDGIGSDVKQHPVHAAGQDVIVGNCSGGHLYS